ncbi:MAG: hypothetical protein ACRC62_31670 [Microcoleus sp.]
MISYIVTSLRALAGLENDEVMQAWSLAIEVGADIYPGSSVSFVVAFADDRQEYEFRAECDELNLDISMLLIPDRICEELFK